MSNIWRSEQELTVQVGYFNVIIISDSDRSVWSTGETHHGHSLHIFATKSTSSDHEGLDISKSFLGLTTIDLDLVIVSAVHGGSVNFTRRKGLEAVVVNPLLEGHVLSSEFDDLLSNKSTEHRSLRSD